MRDLPVAGQSGGPPAGSSGAGGIPARRRTPCESGTRSDCRRRWAVPFGRRSLWEPQSQDRNAGRFAPGREAMAATITIKGRVAGQRRPLFSDWDIALPPEAEARGERLTLRALITRVVLEEVAAFKERQEQRRFVQALTASEIERGLMRGKVEMGGCDPGEG